jgi:isopenicillin-N N-acyltransferase-like protein
LEHKQLEKIETSGDNYDLGYLHGRYCRDKIKMLTKNLLREAIERTDLSRKQVYKIATKYLPYFESAAPHLINEIKGIAKGSALSFEEVLLLNLRHEFMYGIRTMERPGCTSIGVTRERSETGKLIVAQNVDLPSSFGDLMVLFHLKPRKGPKILMYALAGTVGHHGINSYGLARSSNALVSGNEKAYGVSRVVLSRLMLEQKSVDGVIELFENIDRAVSGNYMLADNTGKILDVETTAEKYRIIHPENGFIVHANHILHPDLVDLEKSVSKDSPNRYKQMLGLASSHKGKIGVGEIKEWLRNHEGFPGSVCNHTANSSIASLICHPEEGKITACPGNPCENEFNEYFL